MILINLSIYFISFAASFYLPVSKRVQARRWGLRITLASLAVFLLLMLSPLGILFAATGMIPATTLFFMGIGLYLGSVSRECFSSGHYSSARWIAGISIGLPVVAWLGLLVFSSVKREETQAARKVFLQQTLSVQMNQRTLSLPIGPYLEIWSHDPRTGRSLGRTSVMRSRTTRIDQPGSDRAQVHLNEIVLPPIREVCGRGRKTYQCLTLSEHLEWCAERPDLAGHALCVSPAPQEVVYRTWMDRDTRRYKEHAWPFEPIDPLGVDAVGDPIRVICFAWRDENRETSNLSRLCRVVFRIRHDIEVDLRLDDFDDEELADTAMSTLAYAQKFWDEIDVGLTEAE